MGEVEETVAGPRALIGSIAARKLSASGSEVSRRLNAGRSAISRAIKRVEDDPDPVAAARIVLTRLNLILSNKETASLFSPSHGAGYTNCERNVLAGTWTGCVTWKQSASTYGASMAT